MRKIVFPQESNLQPLDYRSTALPLELEKTPPRMLNFGYLNPATCLLYDCNNKQRWSRGHKARGQGHKKNPRPRTAFPRTDTLEAKDRNARGQGQGPRTQSASALQKKKKFFKNKNFSSDLQIKKKKGLHKNFSGDLQKKKKKKKKVFTKIFQVISRKKKKKVFTKIFQAIYTKKRFPKNFSSTPQNFNIPENSAVLEPRTGQFSRT